MLIEAFYILFFYFTGEFISYFIDGFIPGSVIGMVLLFLALAFKVVKPNKVKKLSTLLTENIGVVFPAGGCGINEFARYHFPVLGCDRNSLRCQHHTRNCQRSTHPAKIRKGNGQK